MAASIAELSTAIVLRAYTHYEILGRISQKITLQLQKCLPTYDFWHTLLSTFAL
ncbi:MAG: hypothetical protein RMK79_09035 [Anaerolineae bacterium]|nr:hypothetical protein [Anaerolineae bacterium]